MKRTLLLLLLCAGIAVASGCGLSPLPLPTPRAKPHLVPGSIDSTGRLDVTEALNTFIRSVPDHATITFPSGGRYRIEGVVVLRARNDLRLEGNGALFFALTDGRNAKLPESQSLGQHWPRHRGQFEILQGTNITLSNLQIRGANPNGGAGDSAYVPELEGQAGIDFAGTHGGLVEGCTITDTYGDFIYIGADAENITVRGCRMERSGRQGISVADALHVLITGNSLRGVGRTVFDLETYSASFGVGYVTIENNSVGAAHGDFVAAKGGGDVSHISIVGNRLHGLSMGVSNAQAGATAIRRHDWLVDNNSSDTRLGSPHAAFAFRHTDNVRVQNNNVPLAKGRTPAQLGVSFYDCVNALATNNNFMYV